LHNSVLQIGLLLLWPSVLLCLLVSAEDGKVGDDLLGVLRLAGPGLAGDEHGLVLGVRHHLLVGAVRDGKEVGRDLVPPLADVHPHHPVGVDGVPLVRVDNHAEQARVGLNIKLSFDLRVCKLEVQYVSYHKVPLLYFGHFKQVSWTYKLTEVGIANFFLSPLIANPLIFF
jgi:hypothetical protein